MSGLSATVARFVELWLQDNFEYLNSSKNGELELSDWFKQFPLNR
jgi:hypothetical protein